MFISNIHGPITEVSMHVTDSSGFSYKPNQSSFDKMMFSSSKENQLPLPCNNGSFNINQISDTKGRYSLRPRQNSQNIYKCEICSKIFDGNSSLEQHMFSVHNSTNGVFICEFCSGSFSQRSSLMQHRCTNMTNTNSQAILNTDFPQKAYQSLTDNSNINTVKMSQNFSCEFCQKTFKTNSALLIHSRSHTGESPYSCEFCGKNFRQTAHLDVHMRIHTGETPFKCNFCNKSFNQKNNRNRHELIHLNGNTEQNPNISGMNFDSSTTTSPNHASSIPNASQSLTVSDVRGSAMISSVTMDQNRSNNLILHRTPQASHTCHLCSKTLNSKSALQVHYRTHTGESPYTCHICNQRFKQSAHLDAHLRVHSKETPFKCQYCDKSFSQIGNKNRHERTHFLNKEGDESKTNTLLPSTREVCHTNSINGCEFESLLDSEAVKNNINHKQVNTDVDSVYSDKGSLSTCVFCQSPIRDCTCTANHSSSFQQNVEAYHFQRTTEQFMLNDSSNTEAVNKSNSNVESGAAEMTNIHKYNNSRNKLSNETICNDNTCISTSSELINSNSSRNHSPFFGKPSTKEFATDIEGQRHAQPQKGVTVCEFCHKDFKSSSSLAVHRRVHTGEMPYKCDYCNKSFKQIPHLDVHMRTHTGEMPFQCLYCDKKFSQKCNRNRHMLTHQNGATVETKSKCDKNEVYSGNQVEKLQSLTECTTCGSEFSEPNSFITHILSHDNLPDLLSQSSNHNNPNHETNYSNSGPAIVKNSQCRVCNETFTDQAGLDQHIASSHTKDSFPTSRDNCEIEVNKIQERSLGIIPGETSYISSTVNNSLTILNNNVSTLNHLGNESAKNLQPDSCNIETQPTPSGELLYEGGYIENSQNKGSKTNNWIEAASLKTSEQGMPTGFVSNDITYPPDERLGTHDCQICNSKFTNYTSFMAHKSCHNNCMEMMKSQPASEEIIIISNNNNNFSEVDRGVFKCELCGKFFPDITSFHYHQQVKHLQEVATRNTFNLPRPSCNQLEDDNFEERANSFSSTSNSEGHLIRSNTNISNCNTKEDLADVNKIFNCKTCNSDFVSQQDLSEHKLCHNVSTNQSVKCNQDVTVALTPSNSSTATTTATTTEVMANQFNEQDTLLVSNGLNVCEFCKKDFRNHSALVIHRRIHTGEMPFQCEYCHRGFRQVAHLDVHLRTHTGETPYKCAYCSKQFSQNCNRIRHQRIHLQSQNLDGSYEQPAGQQTSNRIYNCEFCISKFSNYEEFLDHLNSHNIPCQQDGQSEEYKKKRKLPSVSQSFNSESETPKDWNCCERDLTGCNNKCKQCNIVNNGECDLQMAGNCNKPALNGCIQNCTVSDCENNSGYFVKNCSNSKKVIGNNECELCSVQFVNKDELDVHQVSHLLDQSSTMFSNRNTSQCQSSVNLMKDSVSQGQSVKICEFCEKTFNSTSALITHRRVHTGETPYKCSFCQKSFKQAAHRDVHMRIHTGETPYKCQYCDRSFSQNNNRLRHEKTHQLDNNTIIQSNQNSPRTELQKDIGGVSGSSEQNDTLCFRCPVCGALFENGLDFTEHQTVCFAANDKLVNDEDVDVSNCSVSLGLETDSFPNDDLQPISDLSTENDSNLKEVDKSTHSDKHVNQSKEVFFNCYSCRIKFRTESALNKHKRLCKGSSRQVPITTDDISPNSTTLSQDGTSHLALKINEPLKDKIHNATDLFSCNICGEEFTLASHFNCHMATHSEQKEFNDHTARQQKSRALSASLEESSLHMTVEEFGNCSDNEGLATPQPHCSGQLGDGEDSDNTAEVDDSDGLQRDSTKQPNFKYKKNSQILDFENLIKKEILVEDYENPIHHLKGNFIGKDNSKDTENPSGIDIAMEITSTCLSDGDRKEYFCDQCNIEFTNEEKLHQHRLSVHQESKENYEDVSVSEPPSTVCSQSECSLLIDQHICEFCEKGFNSSSALHVHRRIHTGESPYKCHHCNRRFKQNIHLNVHLRTHTGETPYHCQFCNKKFTQNSNRIRHQRMHFADITTVNSSAVMDNLAPPENNESLEPNSDSCNKDSSDDHEYLTNSKQQWKDKKPLHYNQHFEEKKSTVLNNIPIEYGLQNEPKIEASNSDVTGSIYVEDSQQTSVLKAEVDVGDDKQLSVNTNKQLAVKEDSPSCVDLSVSRGPKYYLRNSHFRCDFCPRQFRSKSALIIHRRVHTGEKPYQCTYCLKSFKQVAHLETHSRIHTGETPFKCSYCRRSFSQKSNCDRHHRIHLARKKRMKARARAAAKTVHLCTICDGRFANASSLSKHKCSKMISLEEVEDSTNNMLSSIPYSCNICGKNYINKGYFERHKQSHTLNNISDKDTTSVTEKAVYLCEICQQNFTDRTQYTEHVFQHISETTGDQEASSYTSTDDVPVDHIREVCYLCEQCKKEFYNKDDFYSHSCSSNLECSSEEKSEEQDSKNFDNSWNDEIFSSTLLDQDLSQEADESGLLEQNGNNSGLNVCEFCNKTFKSLSSLLIHRRVHTGETPFKCPYCKRQFKQTAHLDVHLRTHTGETPFKCQFCDKSFTQNSNKNRHERVHLSSETEAHLELSNSRILSKPSVNSAVTSSEEPCQSYCCDICFAVFSTEKELAEHTQTHQDTSYDLGTTLLDINQNSNKRHHQDEPSKNNQNQVPHRKLKRLSDIKRRCLMEVKGLLSNEQELKQAFNESKHDDQTNTPENFGESIPCHQCEICEKIFQTNEALVEHKFSEHMTLVSNLDIDDCSSKQAISQKTVSANFDNGLQKHVCDYCNKDCKSFSSLLTHRRVHTGETPYKCSYCERSFKQSAHLDVHMRTHTGETPYKCMFCDKAFSQNSNKNRHERLHLIQTATAT